ncbi:ABC transporter ATP-binding protein [Vallitalea sp.]|jgi:oligopeptide transport system ATP-binding protein|uniref:ABC transporter ATP-binding protein n=1 Tax=Vallitalea sp. TaxID=1882829 RepID=UPI0025D1FF6C|nr:ABC transporter ATP-binding protein [Vallitalea sp.]MCT4685872.1 ABC transporter ATP-binding protein [Vallitalea sp.]
MNKEKVLEVKDLKVSFKTHAGDVQAVRGVSFDLFQGETLAIVGESGSGKSVTVKAIMGLLAENGYYKDGEILFEDHDITKMKESNLHTLRGNKIAMIFQDPMTSLDPTMTIGKQIMEVIRLHQKVSRKEAFEKAVKLIDMVGIPSPRERMKQYPHQFSGGMRQRIVIAIALACEPTILIADEPTTALDVTIQAQILDLVKDLQQKIGASVIFITHDLGVVANVADRVAVMYAGKMVEVGTSDEVFYDPRHPYTWGLIGSMPDLDTEGDLYAIPGTPPNLLKPPIGDAFALRSKYAMEIDFEQQPPVFDISDTHKVASWLLHENAPEITPPDVIIKRRKRLEEVNS